MSYAERQQNFWKLWQVDTREEEVGRWGWSVGNTVWGKRDSRIGLTAVQHKYKRFLWAVDAVSIAEAVPLAWWDVLLVP
jgi:N-acetylglucosamine kinase-like BadF-type ATPase